MKEKSRKWMEHPFIYGVVMLVLLTLFFRLVGAGVSMLLHPSTEAGTNLATESVKFFTTFLIIWWLKYTTDRQFHFGIQKVNLGKSIFLTLSLYVLIIFQGAALLDQPLSSQVIDWLSAIAIGIAAGFFEEVVVRGALLGMMMQKWGAQKGGILKATFLSSLAFGLIHFANLTHALFLPTLTQVIYATLLGIFFAAVYLRTHNLWGCIIVHALVDITAYIPITTVTEETNTMNITMIVICLIYALIGLFQLRRSRREGILELWQPFIQSDNTADNGDQTA